MQEPFESRLKPLAVARDNAAIKPNGCRITVSATFNEKPTRLFLLRRVLSQNPDRILVFQK
jgi:hypothetical protein